MELNSKRGGDLSVAEVLETLEDTLLDIDDIFILPPENRNGDTDEDSGEEDEYDPSHLNHNQLKAIAEIGGSNRCNNDTDDEETAECSYKLKKARNWNKGDINSINPLPAPWTEVYLPVITLSQYSDPIEFFLLFMSEVIMTELCNFTNMYAMYNNHNLSASVDELYAFIGILVVTSYNMCPRRRMYWENREDSSNTLIKETMRRNRFDDIFRFLHACNNNDLDKSDKFAKIRPLVIKLNEKFNRFAPVQCCISIDESMIRYYGRHSCKQFMKCKPIRFGYKVWSMAFTNGFCLQFDLYQGKNSLLTSDYRDRYGLGGSVIMEFASFLKQKYKDLKFSLFFDNFFTSAKLLTKLFQWNFGATGTVRENRTEKCIISSNKELRKEARGAYDSSVDKDDNIIAVKWMDNNIVMAMSNQFGVQPTKKISRYSVKQKRKIEVDQPHIIDQYNKNMGGVDLMDNFISNYPISIRGKKWYMPIILWCFDAAMNNAWILSRSFGCKYDKLEFIRNVAENLCKKYGVPRSAPGPTRRNRISNVLLESGRHLVITGQSRRRCIHCGNKTVTACTSCNVPLHDKCFLNYHNSRDEEE